MSRVAAAVLIAGLTLGLSGSVNSVRAEDGYALVGQRAPEIDVHTWFGDGARTSLADYRGDVVLLHFWATTCRACDGVVRPLGKLQREYRRKGLHVLGITSEDQDTVLRHLASQSESVEFVLGLGRAPDYGVTAVPHAYLIDAEGGVVWSGAPGSLDRKLLKKTLSGVRPQTPDERAATHANALRRAEALEADGHLHDALGAYRRLLGDEPAEELERQLTAAVDRLMADEHRAEREAQRALRKLLSTDGYPPTGLDGRARTALIRKLAKFERDHADEAPVATEQARAWLARLESDED